MSKLNVETIENLSATASLNVSDIASKGEFSADTGSSLVGFKANGVGAVAGTVQDKLRESVSVKDFGAVGDGVADDTAAFVAACAASDSVRIPSGTVVTIKDAIIPGDVCIYIEQGAEIKCASNAIYRMIRFDGAATIKGEGKINGNKANQSNRPNGLEFLGVIAYTSGITFTGCVASSISVNNAICDVYVDDCTFDDLAIHGGTTGQDSIHVYVNDARNVKVTDNIFKHPTVTDPEKNPGGIHISGTLDATGTSCVITGNTFTNIGQSAAGNFTGSIDLYTFADETVVTGNIVKNSTYAAALKLQNSKTIICANNIVSGYAGILPIPATAFILLNKARSYTDTVSNFIVTGNIVEDATSGTAVGQGISVSGRLNGDLSVDPVSKVIISGNYVKGRNSGVFVQYSSDCLIASNHVASSKKGIEIGSHNTLSPIVSITGNSTVDCEFGIIHASSDLANASVLCSGNSISGNAATAIHINFTSSALKMISRLAISNNIINGATLGYNIATEHVTTLSVTNNVTTATSQTTMYKNNVTSFIENGNSWNKGLRFIDGESAPTTLIGSAYVYVDSADGDLKVKFGDGIIKTIATDV